MSNVSRCSLAKRFRTGRFEERAGMDIVVRPEATGDDAAIARMVVRAYKKVPYSDHTEQVMMQRLRESDAPIFLNSLWWRCQELRSSGISCSPACRSGIKSASFHRSLWRPYRSRPITSGEALGVHWSPQPTTVRETSDSTQSSCSASPSIALGLGMSLSVATTSPSRSRFEMQTA